MWCSRVGKHMTMTLCKAKFSMYIIVTTIYIQLFCELFILDRENERAYIRTAKFQN